MTWAMPEIRRSRRRAAGWISRRRRHPRGTWRRRRRAGAWGSSPPAACPCAAGAPLFATRRKRHLPRHRHLGRVQSEPQRPHIAMGYLPSCHGGAWPCGIRRGPRQRARHGSRARCPSFPITTNAARAADIQGGHLAEIYRRARMAEARRRLSRRSASPKHATMQLGDLVFVQLPDVGAGSPRVTARRLSNPSRPPPMSMPRSPAKSSRSTTRSSRTRALSTPIRRMPAGSSR